jgi:hypothetical protein
MGTTLGTCHFAIGKEFTALAKKAIEETKQAIARCRSVCASRMKSAQNK